MGAEAHRPATHRCRAPDFLSGHFGEEMAGVEGAAEEEMGDSSRFRRLAKFGTRYCIDLFLFAANGDVTIRKRRPGLRQEFMGHLLPVFRRSRFNGEEK
jgi:hypothetical protein